MKHPILLALGLLLFALGVTKVALEANAQTVCEERFSADTCHTLLR